MIDVVNDVYDAGHEVVLYTARGMTQFNGDVEKVKSELYMLTRKQLIHWRVKYHRLVMGKMHYDMLIDDKAISSYSIKTAEDIYKAL